MRLIDDMISRKALLESLKDTSVFLSYDETVLNKIANAPTFQRVAINEVYEFEKWLKENTLIRANLNIELDYADPLAEIAYKAWQARSKLNLQTVQREGWVSVPIEPTSEMIDAAQWEDGKQTAINVYKLMVAAAPTDTE